MTALRETVARAILRTCCNDDEEFEEMWSDADVCRHNRLLEADAAIAAIFLAIREPTEEMIKAALDSHKDMMGIGADAPSPWPALVWWAMLDRLAAAERGGG